MPSPTEHQKEESLNLAALEIEELMNLPELYQETHGLQEKKPPRKLRRTISSPTFFFKGEEHHPSPHSQDDPFDAPDQDTNANDDHSMASTTSIMVVDHTLPIISGIKMWNLNNVIKMRAQCGQVRSRT